MDDEQTDEHIEEKKPSIAQRIGFALGSRMPSAMSVAPLTPVPAQDGAEESLNDLFEVPQPEDNDINCDDLLELDEEEGVEDLLTVSQSDIVNGADKSKPKPKPIGAIYPKLTGMR